MMKQLSYDEIVVFMISNKLHRDPFLTIPRLAHWLNVDSESLAKKIEEGCGKKFPELLNELRVNEAKDMLCGGDCSGFSVEAIGRMSGFNQLTEYYVSFRNKTGYSPADYQRINEQPS